MKVIQMVFGLFLYIHVLGCIMWYVFIINKTWVPAVDFVYAETKLYHEHFLK